MRGYLYYPICKNAIQGEILNNFNSKKEKIAMSELMKQYYEALERLMQTCEELQEACRTIKGESEND